MNKTIITIGREKGSGGHYIGDLLAQKLGVKCYDKELLVETAKTSGFSEQFIAEYEEKKPSSLLYTLAAGINTSAYSHPLHQQVFLAQSEVIREIAQRESCVFVGRCADYILRDRADVLKCFVHAPISDRIERIAQREKVSLEKAEKIMLQTDRSRAAYYMHFTQTIWGAAKNYHLSVDTSLTGMDGAVDAIMYFLRIISEREGKASKTR